VWTRLCAREKKKKLSRIGKWMAVIGGILLANTTKCMYLRGNVIRVKVVCEYMRVL